MRQYMRYNLKPSSIPIKLSSQPGTYGRCLQRCTFVGDYIVSTGLASEPWWRGWNGSRSGLTSYALSVCVDQEILMHAAEVEWMKLLLYYDDVSLPNPSSENSSSIKAQQTLKTARFKTANLPTLRHVKCPMGQYNKADTLSRSVSLTENWFRSGM